MDRQCDWYFEDQTQCPEPATKIEPEFGMDWYCDRHHAEAMANPA